MGLVRFFLAISVIFAHNGIRMPGIEGLLSVYAFFVISGFYMALVLNEKYQNNKVGFYGARFLRLWPSHIIVFFVVLTFISPMSNTIYASTFATIFTWFSAITMLFYNSLAWLGVDSATGKLLLITTSADNESSLLFAAHMPHIWSIGVEISFYALAPFIARKPKAILIALCLAFVIHLLIVSDLYPLHPLQRFSALNVFWLFLLGMVAYHCWKKYQPALNQFKCRPIWFSLFGVGLSLLCIAIAQKFWGNQFLVTASFIFFAAALIPIFHYTRKSKYDRAIGELSYPIYLTHWPIFSLILTGHQGSWPWTFAIIGLSIICSLILIYCVDKPLEKIRRKMVSIGNKYPENQTGITSSSISRG